jgi:crotonobetainyl-CoA:carnitine CoA-transferase CaiB-like acyl-CoA transferase
MSAFGTQGPWKSRVGFDSIGQAMCGAAYLSGSDADPARTQVSWVDFSTAVHCAYGAVLAVMQRQKTGMGQHVRGSLLASAINGTNAQIIEQDLTARNRPPLGSDAAGAAPIGFFQTRGGWIVVHVVGQPIFERLANLLGRADWLTNPSFASDLLRGDNREPILASVRAWCADRGRDEALADLGSARIPAGPVLAPGDVARHEQVAAADIFYPLREDEIGAPIARAPLSLSGARGEFRPAPGLGADTAALLAEIGMAPAPLSDGVGIR